MTDQPPPDDTSAEPAEDEGVIGEIAGTDAGEPAEAPPTEPPRRRRRPWAVGCFLALLGVMLGAVVALLVARKPAEREEISTPPEAAVPAEAYETRLVFSPTPERPDRTPDIIPADSPVVYCFYELSRVPPDAPLSARWWHENGELGTLELRDLERVPDAEHALGRFSILPPAGAAGDAPEAAGEAAEPDDAHEGAAGAGGFATGVYEVELTSNAVPDVSARDSFMALPNAAKILAGGGEPAGPPVVRSLQTASGVTAEGEAVDAATRFAGDGRIYVLFGYGGVPAGAVLTVRWWAEDSELTDARAEVPVSAEEGRGQAWLEVGAGQRLPPGEYRVSVHLGDEDESLARTGFTITGAPPS